MSCRIFVRKFSARTLLLTALSALAVTGATAQFDPNKRMCTVHGEVTDTGAGQYTLEIEDAHDHTMVASISVPPSGEFVSDPIPAGDYRVRLMDASGQTVYDDYMGITDSDQVLTIHPRSVQRVERPPSGTVSITQLERKIPAKAQKEFEKALKASGHGDDKTAIEHLKKAIEIEPAYMEAYNNLGVRYLHQNQFELAANEFQKAGELDANSAPVFANLSIVLYTLHRFPEAEKAARQAMKLDGAGRTARYVLGLSLYAQDKDESEALENLRAVEKDYPKARIAIAQILARGGETKQAATELKNYLRSGGVDDPQQVKTWIASLESAQ